jgi:two-component system sensor histidine kinase CpxA
MKLRLPLALKVSVWLLLNFVVLASGGVGLMVINGGLSWNSLMEGPAGRRVEGLVDSTLSVYVMRGGGDREDALAWFARQNGVDAVVINGSGRVMAGTLRSIPDSVRDAVRLYRPPRDPEGEPEQPPKRRLLLLRAGQPVAFWITVPLHKPGAPPAWVVLRVPTFGVLLRLLDLTTWIWVAAGAAVVSVLFWLPLVGSLTRDLAKLSHATREIASGRFGTRVNAERRDELGSLGESVNNMAARLDRMSNGQKRFLGDIAHELGSPLGRMQVSVEILQQRADPSLHTAIQDVREEVDHMARLVEELLDFTRAGLQPRSTPLARVELAPLIDRVLNREAAVDGVRVQLEAGGAVQADASLLERALCNLVRNAVRHAGPGAAITIRSESVGDAVHVIVEDGGPGVPPEALARLGEPLFRPDYARNREGGGTGLGLAIVKTCVEACGGSVSFTPNKPQGLCVTLCLVSAG